MQLDEAIETRRSVKDYSIKKPDWRDIIECIDAARYAPMAGNIFSLKFILVNDKEKIQKIANACEQDFVNQSHYLVIVCSDAKLTKNSFEERAEKYLRQQAGAAIQNFLLKLQEKKLVTCWVGYFVDEMIKKELKIPKDIEVEAIFPIAYASGKKYLAPGKKEKIEMDRILFFNKYGNKRMKPTKTLNA